MNLVDVLVRLADAHGYTTIACVAGVSPVTVSRLLWTRQMPKRLHARRALEECARLNAAATRRDELKIVG